MPGTAHLPPRPSDNPANRRRAIGESLQPDLTLRALVLCGPTAVGKSDIALKLAQSLGGEIINADSRQIYRAMPIGTGWPPAHARALVQHHGYGIVNPDERYSAARFVADAREWIRSVAQRGNLPIVVGGTGFYIEALTGSMPLDRPPASDALRSRLRHEAQIHPPGFLYEWLTAQGGRFASGVHSGDNYRVVRRLETALAQRCEPVRPDSMAPAAPIEMRIVVLDLSRDTLRARIADRVRAMFAAGLVQEARAVRAAFPEAPALSSLGYAEALAYHDGLASHGEAIERTLRRTLQYAKRQQTWFRHMHEARRIAADDHASAAESVLNVAREFRAAT